MSIFSGFREHQSHGRLRVQPTLLKPVGKAGQEAANQSPFAPAASPPIRDMFPAAAR